MSYDINVKNNSLRMRCQCDKLSPGAGEMTSNILRVATEARALTLGPFSPSFKVSFQSFPLLTASSFKIVNI